MAQLYHLTGEVATRPSDPLPHQTNARGAGDRRCAIRNDLGYTTGHIGTDFYRSCTGDGCSLFLTSLATITSPCTSNVLLRLVEHIQHPRGIHESVRRSFRIQLVQKSPHRSLDTGHHLPFVIADHLGDSRLVERHSNQSHLLHRSHSVRRCNRSDRSQEA